MSEHVVAIPREAKTAEQGEFPILGDRACTRMSHVSQLWLQANAMPARRSRHTT